jgi:hypothetical protein
MACFEKRNIKSPSDILFYACALMQYWVGLYPEDTQKLIATRVELMMKTVLCLLRKPGRPKPLQLLGEAGEDKEDGDDAKAQDDKVE